MYFKYECPSCQQSLRLRDEHVGRKLKCPYCEAHFTIQTETPAAQQTKAAQLNVPLIQSSISEQMRSRSGAAKSEPIYQMSSSTDTNWLLTGLTATGASIVFLLFMLPLRAFYFGELFWDRGWVPFAMTFLMCWAFAILVFKWFKIAEQRSAMLIDALPTDIADDITAENLDRFVEKIRKLPPKQKKSFLVNRVFRGLEHFRVRRNASEVAGLLTSQSDIDANNVMSSYTMLKVFVWAIPILGFIGTVIGISAAVSGFSGTLESSSDISALKGSLNSVTSGLATAFDTTLVALVMSLLIKFPMASMQKAEENLLNWVDEYCNENLIKRLKDNRDMQSPLAATTPEMSRVLEQAMAKHNAELQTWNAKMESIGNTITKQVQDGLQAAGINTGQRQAEIAQSLANNLAAVQKGLHGLSDVLDKLGQQQVIIQQKRGWFSRRNGL